MPQFVGPALTHIPVLFRCGACGYAFESGGRITTLCRMPHCRGRLVSCDAEGQTEPQLCNIPWQPLAPTILQRQLVVTRYSCLQRYYVLHGERYHGRGALPHCRQPDRGGRSPEASSPLATACSLALCDAPGRRLPGENCHVAEIPPDLEHQALLSL